MFCNYFGISCFNVLRSILQKFTLVFYKSSYCSLWVKAIPKLVNVFLNQARHFFKHCKINLTLSKANQFLNQDHVEQWLSKFFFSLWLVNSSTFKKCLEGVIFKYYVAGCVAHANEIWSLKSSLKCLLFSLFTPV